MATSSTAVRREAEHKRERKRNIGATAIVLVVVAAIAGIIIQSQRSSAQRANLVVPSSAKGPGGSQLLGSASAPVLVEEYGDYQCPHCGAFAQTDYPTIEQMLNNGEIRFAFHPFSFLGPESLALANTATVAGDQGKFWQVSDYFYANQQPENSGYWTSVRLIDVLKQFGADTPSAEKAIKNHTYYPWLRQLNDQASQRGVTSTPTIYVNGVKLADDSPSGLTAAVNSHP
jgi:protein-disulfide isomerase